MLRISGMVRLMMLRALGTAWIVLMMEGGMSKGMRMIGGMMIIKGY